MKLRTFSTTIAAAIVFLAGGCQKTDTPQQEPEERKNFFTYDSYSFDINSVVQYDKGDNSVELWLSPESGLTTSKQIESAGDYIVLNTHVSYLGNRDRFNAQTSQDSYIRFGNDLQYKYGDQGTAYIELNIEGDQISLNFLAQHLYTKAEDATKGAEAQLQGTYTGSFAVEKEKAYQNEWGLNREHNPISKVIMTMREDDGDWSVAMLNEDGTEGIRINFPQDLQDQKIQIGNNDKTRKLKFYYNGGAEFPLTESAGSIEILNDVNGAPLTISVSLINGDTYLRAEYAGGFTPELIRLNRFTFDYAGESPYEGTHDIVKLMIQDLGDLIKFYFSPSEGYSVNDATSWHMPILVVPKSIINQGPQMFTALSNWSFDFDLMQVEPYENDYKPHPDVNDVIEVSESHGEYEVEMKLWGIATSMDSSYIDLYFKGKPQN
jgi:hypothetical protein